MTFVIRREIVRTHWCSAYYKFCKSLLRNMLSLSIQTNTQRGSVEPRNDVDGSLLKSG